MEMKRTKDQQAVIDNRGGTLLVSAAAGSGKTSVLVDRVMDKIIKDGRRIDEFLIITFTKASAQELRSRFTKALQKQILKNPNDRHLKQQMVLIYHTQISTIDAFCTTILREFGHSVNLPPDVVILDEDDTTIFMNQAVDDLLEERYEKLEENDDFSKLLSMLTNGKDDSALLACILDIYRKIQSHPSPKDWIKEQKERLDLDGVTDVGETVWGKLLLEHTKQVAEYWSGEISRIIEQVEEDEQLQVYQTSLFKTLEDIEGLISATQNGWNQTREAIFVEFPRFKAVRNCANEELKEYVNKVRKNCKDKIKKLEENFPADNESILEDFEKTKPAMLSLLGLVEAFSERYLALKRRRGVLDFSDVEHEAIHIFMDENGDATPIAKQVGSRYHEIMVDEYQDTNLVQNMIVSALSNHEKNLFFVGDIKQSIYRFRLADPTIFLGKYRRFLPYDVAKEGEARKILLSQNFRSRPEVLEAVNELFFDIMSEQLGEMDYTKEEALYAGGSFPEGDGYETEFHVLNYHDVEDETLGPKAGKEELEARFVAKEIAKLLQKPFLVSDGKGGTRPIKAEDIAILMRAPKKVSGLYINELRKQYIPCSVDGEEDILTSMEISIVLSFLQIIDNPRQDVPLVSVLQSPLYGFSAEDLAQIRLASQGDLYTALQERSKTQVDCELFLKDLHTLRFEAGEISCHDLVWKLYEKTNAIEIFLRLPNGRQREDNLFAFYDMACQFEQSKHKGLFGFLLHLRKLQENGREVKRKAAQEANGVKLLSIHRSKGLEYPVVFICNIRKKINMEDTKKDVLIHSQLGAGLRAIDTEIMTKFETLPRKALQIQLRRELLAEEMRLLYVAMTRAKEKLIITYALPHGETTLINTAAYLSSHIDPNVLYQSDHVGQWLLLSAMRRMEASVLRTYGQAEHFNDLKSSPYPWGIYYHTGVAVETRPVLDVEMEHILPQHDVDEEKLWDRLTWEYPYKELSQLPAQLTATQIMSMHKKAETPDLLFKRPSFAEEKAISGAKKGSIYHTVLQHIDFTKTDCVEGIKAEILRIANRGYIKKDEAMVVRPEDVYHFFASSIGQRLKKAKTVYREFPFSVLIPASKYYDISWQDETVLLQGVIDCWFEIDGEIVLIDFKTNRISKEKTEEAATTYYEQMQAYSDALEKMTKKKVAHKILWFLIPNCGVDMSFDGTMKKI